MAVHTPNVLGLGGPAAPFHLPQRCGICGSGAIRYRDKFSQEALCQPCVNKYVQAWYLAERMECAFEAPAPNR
jgi:hypothetical protein